MMFCRLQNVIIFYIGEVKNTLESSRIRYFSRLYYNDIYILHVYCTKIKSASNPSRPHVTIVVRTMHSYGRIREEFRYEAKLLFSKIWELRGHPWKTAGSRGVIRLCGVIFQKNNIHIMYAWPTHIDYRARNILCTYYFFQTFLCYRERKGFVGRLLCPRVQCTPFTFQVLFNNTSGTRYYT